MSGEVADEVEPVDSEFLGDLDRKSGGGGRGYEQRHVVARERRLAPSFEISGRATVAIGKCRLQIWSLHMQRRPITRSEPRSKLRRGGPWWRWGRCRVGNNLPDDRVDGQASWQRQRGAFAGKLIRDGSHHGLPFRVSQ